MAPRPISSTSSSKKSIHLVILIHGLFGSPANVEAVAEELYNQHGDSSASVEDTFKDGSEEYREIIFAIDGNGTKGKGKDRKDELVVYSCNSFGWGHTWDGIDINAHRAAKEVGHFSSKYAEGEELTQLFRLMKRLNDWRLIKAVQ